ncbi:MAG: transposase [Thermoplasmata archaeon]
MPDIHISTVLVELSKTGQNNGQGQQYPRRRAQTCGHHRRQVGRRLHLPRGALLRERRQLGLGRHPREVHLGFKIHAVVDAESELPVQMLLSPARETDSRHAIPLLTRAATSLGFVPRFVIADKGYDSRKLREHIRFIQRTRIAIVYDERFEGIYKGEDVRGTLLQQARGAEPPARVQGLRNEDNREAGQVHKHRVPRPRRAIKDEMLSLR